MEAYEENVGVVDVAEEPVIEPIKQEVVDEEPIIKPIKQEESESIQDNKELENPSIEKRWPGWPGDSVFRILVSGQKVGGIIGRKGEFIKKMCEETRARIKILDGPPGIQERAVSSFSSSNDFFYHFFLYVFISY